MIRCIVAGGRDFKNYQIMMSKLNFLFQCKHPDIEIVCGMASGADTLGMRYAKLKGYKVAEFPADWESHGKSAGPIRNLQMAKYATHCVVFWDGKSKGSKNMIETAKNQGLTLVVVRTDNG